MNREDILSRIPHAGAMCLLDSVSHWDKRSILCRTLSHRRSDNPLLEGGRLFSPVAIEYAGQAAAVHSALISSLQQPTPGMLIRARNVVMHTPRLDGVEGELIIHSTIQMSNESQMAYEFQLFDRNNSLLVKGCLSAILAPSGPNTHNNFAERS